MGDAQRDHRQIGDIHSAHLRIRQEEQPAEALDAA
jgi:hypothetical protein